MESLQITDGWPAENVASAVLSTNGELARRGDASRVFRWASVTKPVTALTALVAAEEGTIDLDEPAGPPGSTIRHLLAHASGLPFDAGPPIAKPGTRRIYSNAGFELKNGKQPHFTGTLTSPRTFGHWGGSGTFIWVDPTRGLSLGVLTDREFGDWAKEAWPRLSDAVFTESRA